MGGSSGKDGGDSGFSGAAGTIAIDAWFDVHAEADPTDAAASSDGSEAEAGDAADAEVCPLVRPVQGSYCAAPLQCVYDACSELTKDLALASCQAGQWAVFSQPCVLYPCGALQCLFPRLLCVAVQGGAPSCGENPCISPLSFGASCTCAADLCAVAPTYQCDPAVTAAYYVSCVP